MTAPTRQDMLVETDWLEQHLHDPNLRIVDIRGTILPATAPPPWYYASHDAYQESHIPHAVFVDWLQDIMEPNAPIKATAASPEAFAALMSRLGIKNEHTVVVYDDDGSHIAARLWWLMHYYGHKDVRLLNGGWPKWSAEQRPVSSKRQKHPTTSYTVSETEGWRATTDEVMQALNTPQSVLVDCRGPGMFRGETTRGQRKGRIPGAVNVPITSLVEGPHQTWRSNEELEALFQNAGVSEETSVITYCNAGVSASVGLFALRLLGRQNDTNYDGSWYEWENDPQRPVERDEAP